MRLAVLGSADSWYLKDLARAAGQQATIVPAAWRDIGCMISADAARVRAGRLDLAGFDAVLVRSMPAGSLEQVVFRMDALGRLEALGIPVVNPPRAVEAAIDKYLALARLRDAGLRVPRTCVCQTVEEGLAAFAQLGGDVVVKPLFGSEGRGLIRLNDAGLAERMLPLLVQQGVVLYLQEFIRHPGYDLRVLVIGKRLLAIRRSASEDWRTNVSRGARAEPIEINEQVRWLAVEAARAVAAPLAGVDILPGPAGELYLIEVNAVPGWKGVARALEIDVAALVLDLVASLVRERRR
jgi:ribosomal protein S6--L-glutamate ligase